MKNSKTAWPRRILRLACALTCLAASAGCVRAPGETATDAAGEGVESAVSAEQNSFELEFAGSAVFSDGRISASRAPSSSVYANPLAANTASFIPGYASYRLRADVTVSGRSGGGVVFACSEYGRDGYRFSLDPEKSLARFSRLSSWSADSSDSSPARIEAGGTLSFIAEVSPYWVRIYYGTDPRTVRFFSSRDGSDGDAVVFDCGLFADTSFSNISVEPLSGSEPERTYVNPLPAGGNADPFILRADGKYYLYATNAPLQGYKVFESDDLLEWKDLGLCLRTEDVYGSPTNAAGFWAPEVYEVSLGPGRRFALLYTVNAYVGIAFSDSPAGPFASPEDSYLRPDCKAIDATLFTDTDGKRYLFYVKLSPGEYGIYGREIDLAARLTGPETFILSPLPGSWETVKETVSEGPFVIKHDGTYYLTYSCNDYRSQDYAIGCATCSEPLGKYSRAEGNPVLSKKPSADIYGPGHHSFFTTGDGTLMIAYHRHFSPSAVSPRLACVDRVIFEDAGEGPDRLVILGPTSTPQPLPD